MQHTLKPRSVSVRVCVCESVECASMAGWLTLSYCGILCMHIHSQRAQNQCRSVRKKENMNLPQQQVTANKELCTNATH